LVNLVEDWEIIEEYAGDKQGFYQILSGGKGVEIRLAVGKLGFKKASMMLRIRCLIAL